MFLSFNSICSVILSSSWTKSSYSDIPSYPLNFYFLTENRFSIVYWTHFDIFPSWRRTFNHSNILSSTFGADSERKWPVSIRISTASSTESSVGVSRSNSKISKTRISFKTYWFVKWHNIFVVALQIILLFLLYALWNYAKTLWTINSAISGNLVLRTAIKAAYTWEKFGLAI